MQSKLPGEAPGGARQDSKRRAMQCFSKKTCSYVVLLVETRSIGKDLAIQVSSEGVRARTPALAIRAVMLLVGSIR